MMKSILLLLAFLALSFAFEDKSFSVPIRQVQKRDVKSIGRVHERFGQLLSNTGNMEYRGIISLGTPSQTFDIVFDTGSTVLWLPRRGCKSSGDFARRCWRGHGKGLYDPNASSTSNDTQLPFQVFYNSGMAKGHWFQDVLSLGDSDTQQLRIPEKVTFGVADQIKFDDTGILGLSLPKPNSTGSSILGLLIEHQLIERPIFTTYLKQCTVKDAADNCRIGGKITFGAEDLDNCQQNVLTWAPILPGYHWRFHIQEARLDGEKFGDEAQAISDSGTSYILAPFPAYRKIIDKLKARQLGKAILVPCNSTFQLSWLINDVELTLPFQHLMLKIGDGSGTMCRLAVDLRISGGWSFGTPFNRHFCQIHDVKERKIGFVRVK